MGPPRTSLKKQKNWKIKKNTSSFVCFFCVCSAFVLFFSAFSFCVFFFFWRYFRVFWRFFGVIFFVLFSSSQGLLFLCGASLATQIFDIISCGPGKLDLSRSMIKKGAMQFFPIMIPILLELRDSEEVKTKQTQTRIAQ